MAPSIRYMNQSAALWDFIASLEDRGSQHPFVNQDREHDNPSSDEEGWGWGFTLGPHARGWDWGGPGGRRPWHHGPPPPEGVHQPHGPADEKRRDGTRDKEDGEAGPPKYDDGEPGPAGPDRRHHHGPPPREGLWGRGGHCGAGRGRAHKRGWGPHGRHGSRGPPGIWNMGPLADFIQSQVSGQKGTDDDKARDFAPDVDVFDTETAFVVHASVPGAKKEDINVSWDQEKSELSITGVTFRAGDEEFLKTLAMDERKVGAFERKVRLGSRAHPAQVEREGIQAKMEDGVLFVKVPKLGQDLVEIMKVDID